MIVYVITKHKGQFLVLGSREHPLPLPGLGLQRAMACDHAGVVARRGRCLGGPVRGGVDQDDRDAHRRAAQLQPRGLADLQGPSATYYYMYVRITAKL